MNPLVRFIVERNRLAWVLAVATAVLAAAGAMEIARDIRENERHQYLATDTQRRSIELMSQTLNGNLMGSVAMLGLIDQNVKREANGKLAPNSREVFDALESVGRSYDAEGVFVVAESGVVSSSWDNSGKPSTGLNVKFRPYYQMAMQGMGNVYAAVSLARGDRALYFAAPIFGENTSGTLAVGAIVARTRLIKVDELLRDKADIALLLSPQGVVFASSRKEWIGFLAGKPTAERLRAIRELKQFGNMFDKADPGVLPMDVTPGIVRLEDRRYSVASAEVQWNDPFGEWKLVLMEDLNRTIPVAERARIGFAVAFTWLVIATLLLKMLQSSYRQALASAQLAVYAREQERAAELKTRLAAASVHLQQTRNIAELMSAFFTEAHALFGVMQGVAYAVDGEALHLAGSYACGDPPPATLASGEGLLGQCARERRRQLIPVAPEGFAAIRSGLGEVQPDAILLAPIQLHGTLLAVIEIAFLKPLASQVESQLDELLALLAMNIEVVGRSEHTEETLSATLSAERAVAEQLAFQQVLVDTIPYPVFFKDPDARFLGFNRAYETAFNVHRADLIGKRVLDLEYLPEADRLAYQAEDEATIANVGTIKRDMKIPFADGKTRDTLYFVSGFRKADGTPGGLVGTFIDVSEIRLADDSAKAPITLEQGAQS
jgi:two-component system C4-dicarboxylate transport sensor histidine kinase DctB